jgi:hypothetical protein
MTSVEQKASVLSSLYSQSSIHAPAFISRYMEIIAVSWKAGGLVKAEAEPATKYSNGYTMALVTVNAQSSPDTSRAKRTPQMDPPMAYIPPHARCFHQFLYPPSSALSSPTSPTAQLTPSQSFPDPQENRFHQWSKSTTERNSNDAPGSTKSLSAVAKNSAKR